MRWIISIIMSTLILGAGGYGIYAIQQTVPGQLQQPSAILAKSAIGTLSETEEKLLKDVIQESQAKVVKIELANGAIGSGFLYNDLGDVITNAHVVSGVEDVFVITSDGQEFHGRVIGISQDIDVALVRVEGLRGKEPLPLAAHKKAEIGDEVLALGSPLGLDQTVTTGIISGVDRDFELEQYRYEGVYQISAPIAPGNSGGPLVLQSTGEVLGINSAGMDIGTIGFSIPIANVLHMFEAWSAAPMTDLYVDDYGWGDDYADLYMAEYEAIYLVDYFYECLNNRDYVTAYTLLGSEWQSSITYDDFQAGYIHTYSVVVDEITSYVSHDGVHVTAFITAEETDIGTPTISKYKVTYLVAYENDQMKMISGSGEEIR